MLSHVFWVTILVFCSLIALTGVVLLIIYALRKLRNCINEEDCEMLTGVIGSVNSDETSGYHVFTSTLNKTPVISFNFPVGKYNAKNIDIFATNITQAGFDWNIYTTPLPVISEFLNEYPLTHAPNLSIGLSWAVIGLQNGYGILKRGVLARTFNWYMSPNMFGETINQAQFENIPFVSQILLDKDNKPTILYVSSETTLSALISQDNMGKKWSSPQTSTVPSSLVQPIITTSAAVQDPKNLSKMGLVYMGKNKVTPAHAAVNLAWSVDGFSVVNYISVVSEIDNSYTLMTEHLESIVLKNGKVYVMIPSLHQTTSVPVALVFVSTSLGDVFSVPFVVGDYTTSYPTFDVSWSLCMFGDVVGVYGSGKTGVTIINDTRLFLSDDNFVANHTGLVKQTIAQSIGSRAIGVVLGDEWRLYVCNDKTMIKPTVLVYLSSIDNGVTWSPQKNVLAGQTETDSVIGSIVTSQLDEKSAIISMISNLTNSWMTQIIGFTTPSKTRFEFAAY